MNEKYHVGQFGCWKFTTRVKGKYGYETTYFDIEGAMCTEIDSKHVWLRGTDGICYCPEKKRITEFVAMENNAI
jgi:hypothetical protein